MVFSKEHTFRFGCIGNDGRILLLLVNDKLAAENSPHCCVVLWDNGRFKSITTQAWNACDIVYVDWPDAEFAVVGDMGQLLFISKDGDFREDRVFEGSAPAAGKFRGAAHVDGSLIAVGSGYLAAKVMPGGVRWDISVSRMVPGEELTGVGLEAVTGFSEKELYAVGWEGEIWRYDGSHWDRVASPTNLILSDSICAGDGRVWACGQSGILVRGRGDKWEEVQTSFSDNLWSLAWFQEGMLLCSNRQLLRLDGQDLYPVDLDCSPKTFSHLDARAGRVMLSTGAKDVVLILPNREIRID